MSTIGAVASGAATKFAKGRSPFTGEKVGEVDVKSLVIVDDPLPDRKRAPKFKYDEVFKKMKVGQAIKCKTIEVAKVDQALRGYLKRHEVAGRVKSTKDYGDGLGRVWLLKAEE